MSEGSGQSDAGADRTIEPVFHGRVLLLMSVITLAGSLICLYAVSAVFSVGVMTGGVLGLGSYLWLAGNVRSTVLRAAAGDGRQFPTAKFLSRYIAIGAVLWFIHASGLLPIMAVLLGMSSFAGAVIVEGLSRVVAGIISEKED